MIQDAIRKMMNEHVSFVENILEKMDDTWILCIHDAEFQSSTKVDFNSDEHKFIARTVYHLIENSDSCKARIGKIQYGPKRGKNVDPEAV